MADAAKYARLMEPVARRLLGAPKATYRGGMEWRYGNHEAFKVEIDKGVWEDFDGGQGGGVLDLIVQKLSLPDRRSAAQWLEEQGYLQPEPRQQNDAPTIYPYRDQDNILQFEVVRRYVNGERKFSQRAPDPASPDGWQWKIPKGTKQVPYRLPELLQAIADGKTVFFVEGEKDVDRMWSLGLPATTNPRGASNHRSLPDMAHFFAGADLVVIPDHDPPGLTLADHVLKTFGLTAKRVRLLDWEKLWPQVNLKNDVSDYLNSGGTAEALLAHVEKLPTWEKPGKRTAKIIPFPDVRPPWFDELALGRGGRPLTDLHNVLLVLQKDSRLIDCFAFDEMAQVPMLMKDLPLAPDCGERSTIPRHIGKDEIGCLQNWLQYQQVRGVSFDTVHQAIELRACDRRFHPLRDWLDGLEPQGADPLNSWLQDYFGCPDDDYHRQIGRMFLIAMVARIYKPGCQCDYMPVLEGPQGEVKSQACRALAGDPYFSDHLPDIGGDQVRLSQALRGKWLIEISELSSVSKAENALLKSFITRQIEIFIPKFGRIEMREPRQCLFIGTTNDDTYLKDETGGRRFWPVKCLKTINLDGLRNAREQLFAHAVERFRHDEQYWPDREFEKETIAPQQAARLYQDAWLPVIKDWLAHPIEKLKDDRGRDYGEKDVEPPFTLMKIAEFALGFDKTRFGPAEQRRLGAVMRLCGWKLKHSRGGNTWEAEQ